MLFISFIWQCNRRFIRTCICNQSSSSENDVVLESFYDLNDAMAEYVQHPIRMIFVTLLPFRLGYWLGSFFFDSMAKEKIGAQNRDIYVDKMIAQARDSIKIGNDKNDLATILVKMSDQDGGEVLTTQQLRSHLYTFMFAGFDTSASAIHWILFFVGQFPNMANRIGKVALSPIHNNTTIRLTISRGLFIMVNSSKLLK